RSPGETPGTDFDAFIRKLVPDTELGWKESWKNAVSSTDNPNLGQADSVNAVCIDDDDNVIAVGDTNGVLAGPNNSGALDGWARKLSPAGAVLWTRQIFGGTNTRNDTANGVAADSDGNVLITGSLDFLGNNVGDAYVRKLDPAGAQLWEYEFTAGGATYDSGVAIAVAPAGDPVVLGWTAGDVGGTNAGEDDFFVSKLDADTGTPLWTVQYGTAADDCAWAITVDPSGDVLVAGQTGTCLDSAYPSLDSFVMKLDGDNGSTVWKHDVTTPTGEERARAVAVDPLGNVLVAGHSTGSFDSGKNVNVGKLDVYVRKLSPAGTPLWTNLFGNAENQRAYGVAASSSGLVAMVGSTQGGLDDYTSAGGWDAFIAWLKP
ncbi:MAG TPA: SBBP repeat-containing protein, partial [Polyangiaceae bacterium]|nr:SBBP repeat-containing protein [Polyangiaceae bacterium]